MRLIDMTCQHCGASLQVDADKKQAFCPHCGTQVLIDDGIQHIQYDNAEEAGYAFEKGRQRAQAEKMAQQRSAQQRVSYNNMPIQKSPVKKRKTWLWVLGWICIFPLPLTIILVRKKDMNSALKYGIIVAAWLIYLIIGLAGNSNDSNNRPTTPEIKTEDNRELSSKETSVDKEGESKSITATDGQNAFSEDQHADISYDSSFILSEGNHPCMFEDTDGILDRYPYLTEDEKAIPTAYNAEGVLSCSINIKTKHINSFWIKLDKDYTVPEALDLAKSFIGEVLQYYEIEKAYGVQYKETPDSKEKEYRVEYKMLDSAKQTIGAEEIDRSPVYSSSINVQIITESDNPEKLSTIVLRTDKSSQYFNLRVQGREEFEWYPSSEDSELSYVEVPHIDENEYSSVLKYFSMIDATTKPEDIESYVASNDLFSGSKEYTGGDLEVRIAADSEVAKIGRYRGEGENILCSYTKDGDLKYAEYSITDTINDESKAIRILYYLSGNPLGFGSDFEEGNYYYFTKEGVTHSTDVGAAIDVSFH